MSSSSRQLEDPDLAPPAKRLKPSSSAGDEPSPEVPIGRVEKFVRTEESVGISEFLCPDAVGFQGLLKQRYTDFLVNEIDKDGNVLRLKSLNVERRQGNALTANPKAQSEKVLADPTEANGSRSAGGAKTPQGEDTPLVDSGDTATSEAPVVVETPKPFELGDADSALLISWLGSAVVSSLVKLYNDILAIEREIRPNYKIVTPETKLKSPKPIDDKDARSQLHRTIRNVFSGKIQTATTDEYEIDFWATKISGAKPNNQDGRKKERLPMESWDSLGGEFLHFNLYKENKDTMECLNLLGKFLRTSPKSFSFAGTKDRRAVTVQRVSVHKLKADKIEAINKKLKGLKAGDFEYKNYGLDLGDLTGNEFTISLRDCVFPEGSDMTKVIQESVSSLREKGYINYYGLQRFGTFSISTHEIGKSMLLGDWRTAVYQAMAYDDQSLETAPPDERQRAAACKLWFEDTSSVSKAAEARKLMPSKFVSENAILSWLSKPNTVNDYLGALQKIPRNLRLMFVHAYQSYVWNTIVSERLKKYGTTIRAGDLVVISAEEAAASNPVADPHEEEFAQEANEEKFVRARPVTEEEVASGKFTIYDVVLPSPGWDVTYPQNDLRDLYADIMGQDGLDPFNMIRNQKELSMAGHYRRLLYKPERVEWEIKRYEDPNDQLVETDLMYVQRQRSGGKGKALSTDEGLIHEAVNNPTGSRIAVIVKLTLGTSQYATMALRELTKGGILSQPVQAPKKDQPDSDVKMQGS
ncbi:hypothetical protein TWF225_005638 [Orbilia oligospora]|uniref:Uncharacterized protein n=1 Tax=Orbilia oligospora TaxID=2813651 RepID=A0A7C8KF64_ORBOL|nr:hypothetical protein TWF751_009512 [Orbilia oligospora]KAF3185152.1 hypothetical protein TWF225_005638 [Orbilia oligospora]KAF3236605.1 hypothetical protein TWF128_001334 [Orbilia oligospora]KAF3253810.1 hypothetical protein TWF217_007285 [Orbilia oligospora]KAF3294005.1 hypothetical protein TWF132_003885 [Orbilia oligospora]